MKRIVVFCALCALWGCKEANTPQTEPIALYYSTVEQSKTDLLTQGDEIGVFAAVEGTEHYFLDHTKYTVEADGRSLSTAPAVYYPEAKQAVTFTAYLPFGGTWDGGVGTFSVPSDQTTAAALKQADLCWATASSTPVAAPVALEFRHQMARLLITTNEPTEKIAIPNVFSGGTLDIKTGAFTNTLRSEVFTTGAELILPAQTLSRLLLTVSGVEYVFEGSIALEAAKTTSISLTLSPTQKTATLAGSSTTDWTSSSSQGNTTQTAVNTLILHWPNVVSQASTVNKVVLKIIDKATNTTSNYTISSSINYTNTTFTMPFSSSTLHYPYVITEMRFYANATEVLPPICVFTGSIVYKSGAYTLGVNRNPINPPSPSDYVKIGTLYWAKGNLVATSSIASNMNGCKIGNPEDAGIFFQFGSLIGWRGGSSTSGGTGVGFNFKGGFWSGTSFVWLNEAIVWPTAMVGNPTSWPNNISNQWYFGIQSDWSTVNQNICDYPDLVLGGLAHAGVGDACTYYLGPQWRLPTRSEYQALIAGGQTGQTSYNGSTGRWVGPSPGNLSTSVFFSYNGSRNNGQMSAGYYRLGYYMTSIIESSTTFYCGGHGDVYWFAANGGNARTTGQGVRCVSLAP